MTKADRLARKPAVVITSAQGRQSFTAWRMAAVVRSAARRSFWLASNQTGDAGASSSDETSQAIPANPEGRNE